jgi:outer membrane protein assembly factor BamD
MSFIKIPLVAIIFIVTFFGGCSSKDEEYNKPALYWYNKMIKELATYQIDNADDVYTSLESEHKNSPLIPSALMIIANAHIAQEEYLMADYYLDTYIKRFAYSKNIDYIRYLKIKSKFLAFKNQFREQKLILDTLKETEQFVKKFPNSPYKYLVLTMQSRLLMSKASFDTEIANLYARIDKPKAQEIYNKKAIQSWKQLDEIEPVSVPWYRWLFE